MPLNRLPLMRILHVLDHSIPLHSGYSFRTRAILQQQRARGWETHHVTSPKHTAEGPVVEEVDGFVFHRTPAPTGLSQRVPVLRERAQMKATTARLLEVAREVKPDVLHAHSPVLDAFPALRVGRALGIPVVYEIRAFWEDAAASHGSCREGDLRYRMTRWLETRAVRQVDAVTVICEGLRQDIVARGVPAEKVTVIPNAVDIDAFTGAQEPDAALRAELGLDGKLVLGFLGSFYYYEGLDDLLRAVPELVRVLPDARVLMVGGGPEEAKLHALAKELGITDVVRFVGRVPHSEVRRYYDLVDLNVYPRRSMRITETVTPLKPLEAMAQDRIVIASDVGGHRELIEDGVTGDLFKADDPAALVAAVQRAVGRRDSWDAQRARGRAFVRDERNWARSVANYEAVYARITRQ